MGYLIIFCVFILIVFGVLWGISLSLLRAKRLTAHDWAKRSLGLPRGSVRATLAFMIIFFIAYSLLSGAEVPDLPDWAVGILGAIVGFYFGAAMSRTSDTSTPSNTAETPNT